MNRPGDHNPELSRHILPTAATLLGICATLISLVKILEERIGPSHVDEYGGLIALLFLGSAFASYGAIRTIGRAGLSRTLEQVADGPAQQQAQDEAEEDPADQHRSSLRCGRCAVAPAASRSACVRRRVAALRTRRPSRGRRSWSTRW